MPTPSPKRFRSIAAATGVTVVGIVIFSYTLVHAVFYAPDEGGPAIPTSMVSQGTNPTHVAASPVSSGIPSRLEIPALSIDAHVQQVGTNGAGNMSAPSNFTDVAWYKYGAEPGELGSAVFAGHVDNGLSLAGVFKHLDEVKTGNDIYIETASGGRLHFVVTSVTSYDYKDAPTEQIFEQDDKAYLKLLTCTGDWVPGDRTYDHRLVVTAVLQP